MRALKRLRLRNTRLATRAIAHQVSRQRSHPSSGAQWLPKKAKAAGIKNRKERPNRWKMALAGSVLNAHRHLWHAIRAFGISAKIGLTLNFAAHSGHLNPDRGGDEGDLSERLLSGSM